MGDYMTFNPDSKQINNINIIDGNSVVVND